MSNDKTPVWRHQITLIDRNELTIDGATNLGSYERKTLKVPRIQKRRENLCTTLKSKWKSNT